MGLVLCGVVISVAAMIASLHNWHDALTPGFVGGAIGAGATALMALYTDKPGGLSKDMD